MEDVWFLISVGVALGGDECGAAEGDPEDMISSEESSSVLSAFLPSSVSSESSETDGVCVGVGLGTGVATGDGTGVFIRVGPESVWLTSTEMTGEYQ